MMRFIGYRTILSVLVLVSGFAGEQTDGVSKEGDRAPDFSITTDQGKRISPSALPGMVIAPQAVADASRLLARSAAASANAMATPRPKPMVTVPLSRTNLDTFRGD
jgi:hypothetical protein